MPQRGLHLDARVVVGNVARNIIQLEKHVQVSRMACAESLPMNELRAERRIAKGEPHICVHIDGALGFAHVSASHLLVSILERPLEKMLHTLQLFRSLHSVVIRLDARCKLAAVSMSRFAIASDELSVQDRTQAPQRHRTMSAL